MGIALLGLLAIGSFAGAALGPRYGGDLTVASLALPAALEPAPPRGASDALVGLLVHERLLRLDADVQPRPGLVRDWFAGAGGREWLLRVPAEARFHDGQPVTAEDAARSVRRFLRGASPAAERLAATLDGGIAFRARQTDELPGVSAEGSDLLLRLTEPAVAPLVPLAAPSAAVVSASGVAAGPFVPTANVPGRRLALTAFGAHVRGRPLLDRIALVTIPQTGELEIELQTRRASLVVGAGAWGAPAATLLLVLEASRPPFAPGAVRRAVAEALTHSDVAGRVLPGAERPAGLLPPMLWTPAPGTPEVPPPRSPRAPTPVTLAVSTEVPPLVSQRLVAHLDDLGLRVTVAAAAPDRVFTAPADARLLLWTPEVPEPELALRELASLAPPVAEVEAALAAALREEDTVRRRALLHGAEKSLRAAGVLVPLAVVPVAAHARPNLHGVTTDRAGRIVLEDAWLEP
jgi:MarR-like DNA-binding transcriptional regulator SgrR of sgrS sRNA